MIQAMGSGLKVQACALMPGTTWTLGLEWEGGQDRGEEENEKKEPRDGKHVAVGFCHPHLPVDA